MNRQKEKKLIRKERKRFLLKNPGHIPKKLILEKQGQRQTWRQAKKQRK